MERLGANILKRLEDLEISKRRAATHIGMDPSQFGKLLKGKGELKVAQLYELSKLLDTSMDELCGDPSSARTVTDDEWKVVESVRRKGLDVIDALDRLAATPPGSHSPPNYASPATLTAPDPSKLPAAGLPSATGPERKSGGRSGNG